MTFDNLQKVMEEYSMYLLECSRNNMPDYYKIKNNISFTVEIDGSCFNILFKAPDYWYYVENGRKKGKKPPISVIENWIEIRHITPYPDKRGRLPTKKGLAYIISRSIGENGTKVTPIFFLSRALDEDRSYWNDKIDEAVYNDILANVSEILKMYK